MLYTFLGKIVEGAVVSCDWVELTAVAALSAILASKNIKISYYKSGIYQLTLTNSKVRYRSRLEINNKAYSKKKSYQSLTGCSVYHRICATDYIFFPHRGDISAGTILVKSKKRANEGAKFFPRHNQ